jgi:transcriptional regulator with XRE-family HTH domain
MRLRKGQRVEALPFIRDSIAANLKQARLDAGLTQVEVASRIKKSQSMVSGVEAGRIQVGQKYINAVLKACGQPNDYPVHRRIVGQSKQAAAPRKDRR